MSETEWPSVSVIVPVLNEEEHLQRAVDSILEQNYAGTLDVCLALGPSTDHTDRIAQQIAQSSPRVSVVPNPTGGRSSGLNAAIQATNGSIVVRVDAHSELPPGYVTRAVETLHRTGAVNVGGIQQAVGHTPFERALAEALNSRFGMGGARYRVGGAEGPVDTVFLGVFVREALIRAGLFDESTEGNEDYELNIRLRAAGGIVWFDPVLKVDYAPRSTLNGLSRQFFAYGRWKRAVARRHPGSLRLRQAVPPTIVAILAGSVCAAPWSPVTLVIPAAYLTSVAIASIVVGRSTMRAARLAVIFPTMHLSWGLGFLVGRGPRPPKHFTPPR